MQHPRIVIAGGGAAGFFAAITCAEANPAAEVTLYEATAHPLAKVRISGGGRCNVTHACFDPAELIKRFPRGARELIGPFHRWGPRETIDWFATRGVELKTEADGRMFPVTDDSTTITRCLQTAAADAGVRIIERCGVRAAQYVGQTDASGKSRGFAVTLTTGETVPADRLLLATGGGRESTGLKIAGAFGHTIEPPVPSLFTFHIDDPRLHGLEGLAVTHAEAAIAGTSLRESGPILVTHWGLSGPAILKLSAWGARELHAMNYKASLVVNWAGSNSLESVEASFVEARKNNPRKQIATWNPFGLPARLWHRLVDAAGIDRKTTWASCSRSSFNALGSQLVAAEFAVDGKSMNKEEFVTCGGIRLSEVDFRTMESRLCPGLYFAGEILDIDGVTGGFNFQSAWTTGRQAGLAACRAQR